MTPAQFQQLLITHAPDVPGITAAARRDDENPYGLTVTLEGGTRVWWTITGASPAGTVPGSGPPGAGPVPVPEPDLTSRPVPVARVEQALVAVALAGSQVSPYWFAPASLEAMRPGRMLGHGDAQEVSR